MAAWFEDMASNVSPFAPIVQTREGKDREIHTRNKWAKAQKVRDTWTDAQFAGEAARLEFEIAGFLAARDFCADLDRLAA